MPTLNLADTPELAAVAAAHPATFADLLAAWAAANPPTDPTTDALPVAPARRVLLPDARPTASRPARQHRLPGAWFDRDIDLAGAVA